MKIELLHVPGCENLDRARDLLRSSLVDLGIQTEVEEREGDYPSPTILVDGADVMGRQDLTGAMCRLDLPTRDRILSALRR